MFQFGEFFIPVALFASIVIIVYLVLRKRERMALINKGLSVSVFESRRSVAQNLKWGMVLIGVGIGIIVARILYLNSSMGEEEAFFSMVFIFGGSSLVLFHVFAKNQKNQDQAGNHNEENQ